MNPWELDYGTPQTQPKAAPWEVEYEMPRDNDKLAGGVINKYSRGLTAGIAEHIGAGFLAPITAATDRIKENPNEGFGDIIASNFGKLTSDPKAAIMEGMQRIGSGYEKELGGARESMAYAQQEAPILSTGAEISGALTGAFLGAGTKVGKYAASKISGGLLPSATSRAGGAANYATKVLATGAAAAPAGITYGLTTTEGNLDDKVRAGKEYGLLSAGLGAAGRPLASLADETFRGAKTAITGANARNADELQQLSSGLRNDAVATKTSADLSGVSLNPNETASLVSNLEEALQGVKLIPEFTPKTIGVIRTIKEDVEKGALTLNDIDQYRRLLGGARAEDSVAASSVRKAIDNTLNSLSDQGRTGESVKLLNQFRKEYTQASKFSDVADIIKTANGDRGKIKSKLTTFMNNPNNTKGWSDAEKAALKEAADKSTGENILNSLGRFGFDKNNIAFPTITAGGSILAPAIAMPLVAAGSLARQTGKYIARGKAEKLLQVIENGGQITAKEVKDIPPKQAKEILNLVKRTDKMNNQELREFIEANTK